MPKPKRRGRFWRCPICTELVEKLPGRRATHICEIHGMAEWLWWGERPLGWWRCCCGDDLPVTGDWDHANNQIVAHVIADLPHHIACAKLREMANGR